MGLQQPGDGVIVNQVGLAPFRAVKQEKRLLALELRQVWLTVFIQEPPWASNWIQGLIHLMRKQAAMQVKMNNMVVAISLLVPDSFQVAHQGFVGARTNKVDLWTCRAVAHGRFRHLV